MDNKAVFKRQSYFRLLAYAKPYKRKLAIGILAGFVSAGPLFGSLLWIKPFFQSLENGGSATVIVQQATSQNTDAVAKNANPNLTETVLSGGKKNATLLQMV